MIDRLYAVPNVPKGALRSNQISGLRAVDTSSFGAWLVSYGWFFSELTPQQRATLHKYYLKSK
ncbi:hypothetical protein [Schlesneria sp. DSM 10557]|uniref:hypothetical protein n=1 Tax=Schlesneria sp. DSM 10557 TaxID=3044399 RepID=UPI0035A0DF3A